MESSEFRKTLMMLSDEILFKIFNEYVNKSEDLVKPIVGSSNRWFEQNITGLNEDGKQLLKELEESSKGIGRNANKKQIAYLKTLNSMTLSVPEAYSDCIDPRTMYEKLKEFSVSHDIPEEIVIKTIPSLMSYIETGSWRGLIFVGPPGSGKTTTAKLLLEEALGLPSEIIKIPQVSGSHGLTGECDTYQSADCGILAKAMIRHNSLLVAYIFDEIDKVPQNNTSKSNVDDELLSVTDENNSRIRDNFLDIDVCLKYCPLIFTANNLDKVNPFLADRCSVIKFPDPDASRIKSICRKYVQKKLSNGIYKDIRFDYKLLDKHIDCLVRNNVTSIRKAQQMVEMAIDYSLNEFMTSNKSYVKTTEKAFIQAMNTVLGTQKRRIGF